MPFAAIRLIVQPLGSAMRWALGAGAVVEIWQGSLRLGDLSGETVVQLIAQHLSTLALYHQVQANLQASREAPVPPARYDLARLDAHHGRRQIPSREVQAARKAKRRARA